MTKMVYKVPVVWSMMGYVLVGAECSYDAMKYAKEHKDELTLPTGEYLEDSFEIDEEGDPICIGAYHGG